MVSLFRQENRFALSPEPRVKKERASILHPHLSAIFSSIWNGIL
jgi:hypothetical protein